jgi:tetratricopeptide (TPR) repeat protein
MPDGSLPTRRRPPITALPDLLRSEAAVLDVLRRAAPAGVTPASAAALRHLRQGTERLQNGDCRGSIAAYARVLREAPGFAQGWALLGLSLGQLGLHHGQLACCETALRLAPDFAEAHQALGNALAAIGEQAAAVRAWRQATALKPALLTAWLRLGRTLAALDQPAEAAAAFARSVGLAPNDAGVQIEYGNALRAAGRPAAALQAFAAARSLRPDNAVAWCNAGCALLDLGQPEPAAAAFQAALDRDPGLVDAQRNLGAALHTLGRFEAAAAAYQAALRLRPDDADAANYLGSALADLGRLDAAETAFAAALALAPADPAVHFNHGLALLKAGRLREGWAEHEWRWRGILPPHGIAAPQWQGEPAADRRILLHAEQGLGDTLQFARYAPLVAALGLRVTLAVQPPLVRLLAGMPGVEAVVPLGTAVACDLHCPLLSLPFACGTDLTSVPAAVPYLAVDADLLARWRAVMADETRPRTGDSDLSNAARPAAHPGVDASVLARWRAGVAACGRERLRVGLVWAGSPRPADVRAHFTDRRRSIPLAALAPLGAVAGVQWISLQKDAADLDAAGFPLLDPMRAVADFADTAAIVAQLDLVIAVDTAVAHVAGALGVPVWLLSRFDGCWRWLTERDDSPWYPSLRLYRQPAPGDWTPVVQRVVQDLRTLIGAP